MLFYIVNRVKQIKFRFVRNGSRIFMMHPSNSETASFTTFATLVQLVHNG